MNGFRLRGRTGGVLQRKCVEKGASKLKQHAFRKRTVKIRAWSKQRCPASASFVGVAWSAIDISRNSAEKRPGHLPPIPHIIEFGAVETTSILRLPSEFFYRSPATLSTVRAFILFDRLQLHHALSFPIRLPEPRIISGALDPALRVTARVLSCTLEIPSRRWRGSHGFSSRCGWPAARGG